MQRLASGYNKQEWITSIIMMIAILAEKGCRGYKRAGTNDTRTNEKEPMPMPAIPPTMNNASDPDGDRPQLPNGAIPSFSTFWHWDGSQLWWEVPYHCRIEVISFSGVFQYVQTLLYYRHTHKTHEWIGWLRVLRVWFQNPTPDKP